MAWVITAVYHTLWLLAATGAFVTARVAPGHIPLWLYSREPGDQAYFHNVLQAVEKKLDGTLRFCRKCGAFKPDLAHHSRELGLCVLCYQHWDLWSNNAIGFYNYKPYVLTLLYGALAHGSGLMLLLAGMQHAWPEADAKVALLAVWAGGNATVLGFTCLSAAASAVCSLTASCWLLFHVALIVRGQTARTFFRQIGCTPHKPPKARLATSPFDFGMLGNFRRTCGKFALLWLLPTNHGLEGNGIFFELNTVPADNAAGKTSAWTRHG